MTAIRVPTDAGVSLAADALGDPNDPAVLLFHGGGQTRHAWGGGVAAMAARHWFAVTFDMRGHGESSWSPDGHYDIGTFAHDVGAVSRAYQHPVLVGASLGGLSSMVAIGEGAAPNAVGLVLVDVTPRVERKGVDRIRDFMRQGVDGFDSLDAVADAVASYLPHRKRPTDLSGLTKNVRQREDGKWVWHWDPKFFAPIDSDVDETDLGEASSGRFTPPERLLAAARAVKVPTLLVRGGSSDVVSEAGARELQDLIPHAEVVDVAGAGHMVAGDRNDPFNDAVIEFLDRVIRPSR